MRVWKNCYFWRGGFHQDAYSEFRNRMFEAIDPQDLTSLRTIYQREYQQLPFSKDRQQHILNAILIKSYMKAIDETVTLTLRKKESYMIIYFVSKFGDTMNCCSFLPALLFYWSSFYKVHSRNVAEVRFLARSWENRNMMHTLLLNAFMACIEIDDLPMPSI